jgi:hypothetical protein
MGNKEQGIGENEKKGEERARGKNSEGSLLVGCS